ncbi:tyrosine-type recombinase/integrase [Allorhizocola rhizosphaerae]|uniref:tyrosine-type recombinase/integrase n=1 Tax=Allorhizocola rhizosphaerae TaxID=1872709 RepID=UPI000E3C1006|nr:tyrosine-type recombinase/integrase [Allorhizocola rhizosphaerae]
MKSYDVKIWNIQVNRLTKGKSYTVRWKVAKVPPFSRTFVTRPLADNFRSDLKQAINAGEPFDTETGLPDSLVEEPKEEALTWLDFAMTYVKMKWPGAAAKSRTSMVDALATVTPALCEEVPGRPEDELLRDALRDYLLPPDRRERERPEEIQCAVAWLECNSVALSRLAEPAIVRAGLDAIGLKMDGKPAAVTTMRRKRSVFFNVLQYAVELELLDYNPIDKLRVRSRRSKVVTVVDRRVVVNPKQARQLLAAVTYIGERGRGPRMRAFFACLYFAALRPGEALGLRAQDCNLPEVCEACGLDLTHDFNRTPVNGCEHEQVKHAWGLLSLEKNRPAAGKRWTDSGQAHDERALKHRGEEEPRPVPIPPELVGILREHIRTYGVGEDGRIFSSRKGNVIGSAAYSKVWREARAVGLSPAQAASPLAGRPYDLRHAGVSLWLNAGVPAPEVAERAGHSVDVLLKVYAKCIDGQADVVNQRIEAALSA